MLAPETVLQGRYRVVRQLGQGGMGAVYEAVDERLDTVVALKETLFAEERLRKQFEREARLLARLHHPALPRVSDHFNEADGQFLVMQYISGEDFFEMISQRQGPFSQAEVLQWGDQLCDALDYLHTQDPPIIHRDIKPQNLKLTTRGQVVLLDFGLAKGSGGQMSVVTTSASIFGYTPNYAPLEQVQGLGTDARSDIYSLSATLYHLLTSVKPPDALTRAGAVVNGQADPLTPANQVSSQVSPAVASVLSKGMSQKRDDRFESAAEMRNALRLAAEQPATPAATVITAKGASFAAAATVTNEPDTKISSAKTLTHGSEDQTLLAGDATRIQASVKQKTVQRQQVAPKRSFGLIAAAVLVVLIAGSVGAFYLYRTRRQVASSPQNSLSQPAETTQPAEPNETGNSSADNSERKAVEQTAETKSEKPKTESANQRPAASKQPAEKNSDNRRSSENQTENNTPAPPDPSAHERERDPNRGLKPPNAPNDQRNSGDQGRQPNRNQMPDIRTFRNGMRVITQPDGTRFVTLPNGTTRIIPPKQRRNPGRP